MTDRRRWYVWRIARALGERYGLAALDSDEVMSLLLLADAAGLTDDESTRAAAHGVILGARMKRLEEWHRKGKS